MAGIAANRKRILAEVGHDMGSDEEASTPSFLASPSTQRNPVQFEMGMYSSTPAAQAQQLYADSRATSAKPLPPAQTTANAQEFSAAAAARAEEREDAEVGLSHKDSDEQTFTEYVPHTFSAAIFQKHPDPVVETASLSSLMPPKKSHKLHLCAKTITQGLLTNLQLETINLACQQHELRLPVSGVRSAFFMGDGPGVGKGRQSGRNYSRELAPRPHARPLVQF